MEDWKLKKCWVVVTDCLGGHPAWKERVTSPERVSVAETEVEPGKTVSESSEDEILEVYLDAPDAGINCSKSGPGSPETIKCNSDTAVKSQLTKHERPVWKSAYRRKGSMRTSSNHSKNHSLLQYGRTLPSNSSFSTMGESTMSKPTLGDTKSPLDLMVQGTIVDELKSDGKSGLRNSTLVPKKSSLPNELSSNQNSETTIVNQSCSLVHQDLTTNTDSRSSETVHSVGGLFTNPSCPMPAVGLTLTVGVGHPLQSQEARCALTCLKACENSLTSDYVKFCAAVVKTPQQSPEQVLLPINDEEVVHFMQIKWNARCAVKRLPLSSHPRSATEHQATDALNAVPFCKSAPGPTRKRDRNCRKEEQEKHTSNGHVPSPKRLESKVLVGHRGKVTKRISHPLKCASNDLFLRSEPIADEEEIELHDNFISRKLLKFSLLAGDKEKKIVPEIITINGDYESGGKFADNTSPSMKGRSLQNNAVKASTNGPDTDDEICNIRQKTAFDIPAPSYDPDDTRGMKEFEEVDEEPRGKARSRCSNLMHELRRLNVAVFDMTNSGEPVVCKSPDICRLGCVCSSLSSRVVRDNCGLERCMFRCVCLKTRSTRRDESFTWMHNKAKANLAKEERNFKQTVVRSGKDDLIVVDGKRKREIKLPKKYREDFVSETDCQLFRKIGNKKLLKLSEQNINVCAKVESQKRTSKGGKNDPESLNNQIKKQQLCSEQKSSDSCDVIDHGHAANKAVPCVSDESETESVKHSVKKIVCNPVSLINSSVSARTKLYSYSSKQDRQSKQQQLLQDSLCVKVEPECELKIVSTQSLGPEDWEETENQEPFKECTEASCSFLFNSEFIKEKGKDVVLLPWAALRKDIDEKKAFLWYRSVKSKAKIYLTNNLIEPCENCVELQSFDVFSDDFKNLPSHLKRLRSDSADGQEKCVWITKYVKSQWMIVGFMQPEHQDHQPTAVTNEVDILPSLDEDSPNRWWMMDLRQNFDLLYFMDYKKALSKRQLNTLVSLSNEDGENGSKVHRILLNRRRPKIDPTPVPYPDFGAYSLSQQPNLIFIGPYESFKEPRFQVFSQKVAHNGKVDFEAIPLFYCGEGECVRVNSQGVLSLHSETLPSKFVQGSWYQSTGRELRELDGELLADQKFLKEDGNANLSNCSEANALAGHSGEAPSKAANEVLHCASAEIQSIAENENELTELNTSESLPSKSSSSPTEDDNVSVISGMSESNDKKADMLLSFERTRSKTETCMLKESQSQGGNMSKRRVRRRRKKPFSILKKRTTVRTSDPSKKDYGLSKVLPNKLESNSDPSASKSYFKDKSHNYSESGRLGMEYLVPNLREIGVLSLTYLPGGTISVINFTEPGLLKFYHNKEEVIKEINMLIHHKLACLSRKCSVFLKKNQHCKCVTWNLCSTKLACEHLPQFNPEIFNGFFMLTNYGLLDLRSADERTISKLGQDWVEWLKNDEIRIKLNEWKLKEEHELMDNQKKLIKVLTSSQTSNLTLLQVLGKATDEIAKLKADNELLDLESQTQELLKETLIFSLCRKLNGIPGSVIPKFLEQLDLNLLWEVLECMDSRNTTLLPAEGDLQSPPVLPTEHPKDYLTLQKTPSPQRPKQCARKRTAAPPEGSRKAKELPSSCPEEPVSPRTRAIRYRQRLMEQCWMESMQQQERLKVQTGAENASEQFVPLMGNAPKEGLVCRVSPFARLNICVEEGGIKFAPRPSLSPRAVGTSGELAVSPGKPPNILRKSKTQVAENSLPEVNAFLSVNSIHKQARKQIFSHDNSEQPVFVEDSESTLFPSDELSKEELQHGAKHESNFLDPSESESELEPEPEREPDSEPEREPDSETEREPDSEHEHEPEPEPEPEPATIFKANWTSSIPHSDPVSSLKITSVTGAENIASSFGAEMGSLSSSINMKSMNSLANTISNSAQTVRQDSHSSAQAVATTSNSSPLKSSSDPISSLRITSVFSAQNVIAQPTTQNAPSTSALFNPVSAIRISSVTSEAIPSSSSAGMPQFCEASAALNTNPVLPHSSSSSSQPFSSSLLSIPSTSNSSGLVYNSYLRPVMLPAKTARGAPIFSLRQVVMPSGRAVRSPQSVIRQVFPFPVKHRATVPAAGAAPYYMYAKKDGNLVRNEAPIGRSQPLLGVADSQSKTIKIVQQGKYTITVPVSALKMHPPAIYNSVSNTNVGSLNTSVSAASSTIEEKSFCKISPSSLVIASTVSENNEIVSKNKN